MKTLTKIAFTAFLAATLPFAAYADTITTTTTVTTFRTNAPIYMGTVENTALLEPLTLEDFQNFGTKPAAAFQEYQDYKLKLKNSGPDAQVVPYKMKADRTLTIADFQGVNVSPELAQERYENYMRVTPIQDS